MTLGFQNLVNSLRGCGPLNSKCNTAFTSSFVPRRNSNALPKCSIRTLHARRGSRMSVAKRQTTKEQTFRLSPSDFAFLWEECKRCFYLKAHKKMYRPRAPFPSIFGTIDLAMKLHLRGLPTHELLPDMPKGTFLCENEDAWVECKPFSPPGHQKSVFIRGMVDCLVRHEDGTFGVIDFKTSSVSKTANTYARQLHAYTYAIENPSEQSELVHGKVTNMGLVVFSPSQFHTPLRPDGGFAGALTGNFSYVHVERDDEAFEAFIGDILDVLELPEAPPPPKPKRNGWSTGSFSSCPYCQFLHDARSNGLLPDAK